MASRLSRALVFGYTETCDETMRLVVTTVAECGEQGSLSWQGRATDSVVIRSLPSSMSLGMIRLLMHWCHEVVIVCDACPILVSSAIELRPWPRLVIIWAVSD